MCTSRKTIASADQKRRRATTVSSGVSSVQRSRRGFSMVLVMLAIGFSLALTYGFMRTQVTSLQLTQNEIRRDLALEAARTGISAGLLRIQDPTWVGITDTFSKTTQQDSTNLVTCAVAYGTVASGQVVGVSDAELPLHVSLTSTGTWSSPRDSSITVSRTIRTVIRLMPRLPSRTVRPGDVSTATDISANPSGYQATLGNTLTTTSTSSTTLSFDAGTRIEGPIWTRRASIYNSESWSSTIRGSMLTEIGNQYGSTSPSTFVHPHPVNGPIQFTTAPSSSTQTDLSRLKTTWLTTTNVPSMAALDANAWTSYRLYDRGPVYQATILSGTLGNVTLRPSATNPLGIFVRSGNLDVFDQVNVQGTLVVTGTVSFWGVGSAVTSYNWIASSGGSVITDADKWPRLPAIAAKTMTFYNASRVLIEGAVIVDGQFSGGGGDYSYPVTSSLSLTGTCTATRGQQPYSTIQLQGTVDLSAVVGIQNYAIWLANGTSGRWYQIQSADLTAKTLTVIGEVSSTTPITYRIRPNRTAFVDIHGPVVVGAALIDAEAMWNIASIVWTNTTSDWNQTNTTLLLLGKPRITFPDWVANPANLIAQGWTVPWKTALYGLQLEPTFWIQPTTGVDYLATPPLFTPYNSTGSDATASGYRWKIIDWREDL